MGDFLAGIMKKMDRVDAVTKPAGGARPMRGRGRAGGMVGITKREADPELVRWRRVQNERVAQEFLAKERVPRSVGVTGEKLAVAAARTAACGKLFDVLRNACTAEKLAAEPNGALLRWLFTQKMVERAATESDPVLPSNPCSDPGLVFELKKEGLADDAVARVETALRDACAVARSSIAEAAANAIAGVAVEMQTVGDAVVLTHLGFSASIRKDKFQQLEAMWRNQHSGGTTSELQQDVFRLVARYEALRDGDSYQAALPPRVFALLRDALGVTHECFASPLNRSAEITSFSSAYPDVDAAFGSHGDFFAMVTADEGRFMEAGGSFEANPPFLEEVMLALAHVLQRWLDRCKGAPLSFVVVFPDWKDTPAIELLTADVRCRRQLRISRKDHVYLSGAQHKPGKGPRLISYSETLILVLQNDAGAKKWPFDSTLEKTFRAAFARPEVEKDPSEMAAKKQKVSETDVR